MAKDLHDILNWKKIHEVKFQEIFGHLAKSKCQRIVTFRRRISNTERTILTTLKTSSHPPKNPIFAILRKIQ